MFRFRALTMSLLVLAVLVGCGAPPPAEEETPVASLGEDLLRTYTRVALTTDTSVLSENQKAMIPLLIEACAAMEEVFWQQSWGKDPSGLLESIDDPALRSYTEINFGPWDRLNGNEPFLEGFGPKPKGAGYYPQDMTVEEFEKACQADADLCQQLKGLYTVVRRDDDGGLVAVPFSQVWPEQFSRAAALLRQAAELAEDEGLKNYLMLRAEALETDDYRASDMAWMDMKSNQLDVVIGPIENYEDKLFGYKTAAEGYVLVKDMEWSERLARYTSMLPGLQKGLPVADAYKAEMPGSDSDLNAYDVVFYAGDCNAGSKTIAINLPNDEEVQLAKGTRRLQLKNAMRAKFDEILLPIGNVLIAEDQRSHVTFDAFFENTMFHEVAHGLGIKTTITGQGTVREALKDLAGSVEEGKADILGLYMVTSLIDMGEMGDADAMDNYVTFLAGIFRSVRFGSASAHGVANMIRFNFFEEAGAFTRDDATGTYRADPEKMQEAMNALSEKILTLQGDGDYEAVKAFVETYGAENSGLRADLDRLSEKGIPVDVVFDQGVEVLGLEG